MSGEGLLLGLVFLPLPTRTLPRNHNSEADSEKDDKEDYAQNHDHVVIIPHNPRLCNLTLPLTGLLSIYLREE